VLAELPGYQVIVAFKGVTTSRVPALLQNRYHTGGFALASAQWHRPLAASPGDEKPPVFYTHSFLAQIPLGVLYSSLMNFAKLFTTNWVVPRKSTFNQ
jgi:hypothetical protein